MAAMSPLDEIALVLAKAPTVRLAVVFGSAARGSAGPNSDIDLGVSLQAGADDTLASLAVEVERATGTRVDLVSLDDAPPLLRFEIARGGHLLVERAEHAWAGFRARAMIDWWDWAPTARMMHRVMVERLREEAAGGPA
jgi:uncharacterized protein